MGTVQKFNTKKAAKESGFLTTAADREPKAKYQSSVRLMDAIHTVEEFKDDPTLEW